VLGLVRVTTASRGIDVARAVLRITGSGHSAAIHSNDAATVMAFSAAVPVLRVSVNVGNSLGSAGLETNLPPSMTIGTGFAGHSSLGENLQPKHFVNYTRIAYNADATEPFGEFAGMSPWVRPLGPVPAYPVASNATDDALPMQPTTTPEPVGSSAPSDSDLREEIRRLIIEELDQIVRG